MPSELSQIVVGRAVTLCKNAKIGKIGVIENMSGFVCPGCGVLHDIFKSGGGKKLAENSQVVFLGKIPLDQRICESSDEGVPFVIKYPKSLGAKMIGDIVTKIEAW